MEERQKIQRFGNIHRATWGEPERILNIITDVSERMLRDRGADEVQRTTNVIHAMEHENGHVIYASSSDGCSWDVFIHTDERIGVKYARSVIDECEERGTRAILVSIDGPTPFTRRECEGRLVQFFLARDMCVSIVDHCLVPKHERIEASELPPNVNRADLPRMEQTDKIAQYYDWPVGTIVRIVRVFGGHEPIMYYRVVVASTPA